MSLLDGNKSILKFTLIMESANPGCDEDNSPWRLFNKINSTRWMDKEPESCKVVDIKQMKPVPVGKTAMMDHAEFEIMVGYRPRGWISDKKNNCRQRLNGWVLEVCDQTNNGILLNGSGKPLLAGKEPVYLRYNVYETADFNDYDFGHFEGEES
jgi:hypothetical protein